MYILSARGKQKIELDLIPEEVTVPPAAARVMRGGLSFALPEASPARRAMFGAMPDPLAEASPVQRAKRAFFYLGRVRGNVGPARLAPAREPPARVAVFQERATGLIRVVYQEIVIRFKPDVPHRTRRAILKKHYL